MATCCGADPEGYAHSYTHYVEPRPTTQRGSGYIHRYLEAVHTEMNHSPQSIPVCPSETGHHRTKRAYLVGLHSISEQSHPIQSLSSCVAPLPKFPRDRVSLSIKIPKSELYLRNEEIRTFILSFIYKTTWEQLLKSASASELQDVSIQITSRLGIDLTESSQYQRILSHP